TADVALEDAFRACSSAINAADVIAHQAVYPDDSIETTDRTEAAYTARRLAERARQCHVLRCVVGNAVRPTPPHLTWQTPAVLATSEAAYDQRILPGGELDDVRLVILADALEEAGCTDARFLGHLRGPGPHVLGCWPVDLLLDKR